MLLKLRETLLFWIRIDKMRTIPMKTSATFNISSMNIYYLENKNEYTIFKMVKIATAIKKFIQPLMSYETQGIMRRDIIKLNIFSTIAFTKNTTKPKKIKNSGNETIFISGRMVILSAHRIIHHST